MPKVKIGSDDKKLHFVGFAVLAWVVMFTGISFNCECLHVYCMNLYMRYTTDCVCWPWEVYCIGLVCCNVLLERAIYCFQARFSSLVV